MQAYDESTAATKVKDNDMFYTAKITMVRAHMRYLQFHIFRTSCDEKQFRDPRIKPLLDVVGRLYCLTELLESDTGPAFFDSGFFPQGSLRKMTEA